MSNTKSKLLLGTIRGTFSDAVDKAWSNYSFGFKLNGTACRISYDYQKGALRFENTSKEEDASFHEGARLALRSHKRTRRRQISARHATAASVTVDHERAAAA